MDKKNISMDVKLEMHDPAAAPDAAPEFWLHMQTGYTGLPYESVVAIEKSIHETLLVKHGQNLIALGEAQVAALAKASKK